MGKPIARTVGKSVNVRVARRGIRVAKSPAATGTPERNGVLPTHQRPEEACGRPAPAWFGRTTAKGYWKAAVGTSTPTPMTWSRTLRSQ